MMYVSSPNPELVSNYICYKNCRKSESPILLNMNLKSEFLNLKLGFIQRYKASARPINFTLGNMTQKVG